MGGVFLGMPGPWAEDDFESSDHYTTKIGGLADWPIPETDVEPSLLKCGVCGNRLCLVAQVYAPIDVGSMKVRERTIYVMGCIKQGCGSSPLSWRTLRFQKAHNEVESRISSQKEAAPSEMVTNSNNWWEEDLLTGGDDEGEDVDLEELGRALSEAGSLASHPKKQNGHAQSDTIAKDLPVRSSLSTKDSSIPVVPCFYIFAQEEQSSNDLSSVCSNYSSLSIKGNKSDLDDDDDHRDEEKWEAEAYEYDKSLTADRTYLKFKKRMDAYPEQCFRYSYSGKPLFATTSMGEPGSCVVCGGSRHYEMQLMPPLLYFLRQADGSSMHSVDDWDWMTLIIYTCTNNCSIPLNRGYTSSNGWTAIEEATIVQHEKSLHCSNRLAYFT